MKVTFIGHAGLFIETAGGSILCDPWFNPAYFASWFPFPSNAGLAIDAIACPDYLYVSHLHHDHFDPEFLAAAGVAGHDRAVARVPPRRAARRLERPRVLPLRAPAPRGDGRPGRYPGHGHPRHRALGRPFGDSALAVDDGTARLLDQNDARPRDLDAIKRFGPFDAHFLQFSGAIWYPVVYEMAAEAKAEAGHQKRIRGMDRARLIAEQVDAAQLFPCAGPPCFLDETLFGYNDLGDGNNPFPDQTVFLDYLAGQGHDNAHLVVPGTTVTLVGGGCEVVQPAPEAELMAPFRAKRAYLEAYQAQQRPAIEAARSSWPRPGEIDVVAELKSWWEPLLANADQLCARVGAAVLLEAGDIGVVIDFPARQVRAHAGEHCPYRFRVEPGVVDACIRERAADWVNGLFLSLRFTAGRDGAYNESIYTFFKCLSEQRLHYAETWNASEAAAIATSAVRRARHPADDEDEWYQLDGWRIPRRCPHLQGDLARFGSITDDVLTCKLHGWRFDLETGSCLTTGQPDVIKADRL